MVMIIVGGVVWSSTEFPYYSERRKPTGREFFVPAQTLIGIPVKCFPAMCETPHLPLTMHTTGFTPDALNTHMTHPRQSIMTPHIPVSPFISTMPWECAECTYIHKSSSAGKGPYIMCMHDDPPRIKVEVEDVDASPPSRACKITGTVTMWDLMADVGNLNSLTPKCVPAGTKNSRSEGFLLVKAFC